MWARCNEGNDTGKNGGKNGTRQDRHHESLKEEPNGSLKGVSEMRMCGQLDPQAFSILIRSKS